MLIPRATYNKPLKYQNYSLYFIFLSSIVKFFHFFAYSNDAFALLSTQLRIKTLLILPSNRKKKALNFKQLAFENIFFFLKELNAM